MVNIKEKINEGWLHVNIIIELLGKPAEHLEKVINAIVDKLEKEKDIIFLAKNIHPAKLVKESQNAFTTFAEVEILVSGMPKLVEIIFDYMPASIEIIAPVNIKFKLEDANALLNDLTMRLHQYDAVSKRLRLEQQLLVDKVKKLQKEQGQESEEKK